MKRFVYALVIIAVLAGAALIRWQGGFRLPDGASARSAETGPVHEGDEIHKAAGEKGNAEDDHGGPDEEGGICPEHRVPEAEDALCRPEQIAELKPGQGMKVRLAAPEAASKAGIAVSLPKQVSPGQGAGFPVQAGFNRSRTVRVAPLAAGIIREVLVQPGDEVGKGDVLARIAMPEIASLKAQLLTAQARQAQAEAAYLREKDLLARGITSRREFQEAEAEFRAAESESAQFRQQLSNFGLSVGDIQELLRTGSNSADLEIRSPLAGTVVEMETAAGELAVPGVHLLTLSDLGTLWMELSVSESRIYQAVVGVRVEARFDGLPDEVFTGRIFQAGAALDERSRVLKVLAEVENPGHRLKAGMFGKARIVTGAKQKVLGVPADAVQSIDGVAYLFVRLEKDLFELRRVEAGVQEDGWVAIRAGLAPGDQVVTSQGFALKSEVLKARLGAGCTD